MTKEPKFKAAIPSDNDDDDEYDPVLITCHSQHGSIFIEQVDRIDGKIVEQIMCLSQKQARAMITALSTIVNYEID